MKDITIIDYDRFTLLRNVTDDIMIMLEDQPYDIEDPKLVYTSSNEYYLMFNSKFAMRLNLTSDMQNYVKKAKDILIVETKDGMVTKEYKANVIKQEENNA